MLIAPIEVMVGKKVRAETKFLHAAKLGSVGQLAMLQGVAVIRPRHFVNGTFERIEHHVNRLITIRVRMHHEVVFQSSFIDFLHLLRGCVPQPVRCAIVVTGPAQTGGEALDRSISMYLDATKAQTLCTHRTKFDTAFD